MKIMRVDVVRKRSAEVSGEAFQVQDFYGAMRVLKRNLFFLLGVIFLAGCVSSPANKDFASNAWTKKTFGTYDAEPRKADGRVDVDRLVRELVTIKAPTYNFLVWRATNDWEDFKLFLPKARKHGIKVWITICPPSESPPHSHNYSEPFRLDYLRWAEEIAKLSLQEPNLVAWSVDDYLYSPEKFTLDYIRQMVATARDINPKLKFIPCFYYGQVSEKVGREHREFIDGVLFPYRHEAGKRNLSDWDTLVAEIARVKARFGGQLPVYVDVYATKHSQLNDSSAEYVEQVMKIAREHAEGVMIYCHQYEDTSPAKYRVVKKLFLQWNAEDAGK